jgi:hypothetical protein
MNSKFLMPCHAKKRDIHLRLLNSDIRNICTGTVARCEDRRERTWVVHADKASPHTAKVRRAFCDDNFLRIAPHPPYSPDLAPSDFLLFEDLKNRLQGQQLGSADEFLSKVLEILDEINVDTLEAAFRERLKRLERCIVANVKYMEWCKQWSIELFLTDLRSQISDLRSQISDLEMLISSWNALYRQLGQHSQHTLGWKAVWTTKDPWSRFNDLTEKHSILWKEKPRDLKWLSWIPAFNTRQNEDRSSTSALNEGWSSKYFLINIMPIRMSKAHGSNPVPI